MLSDISPGSWFIILFFMAFGFGLVRFLVVSMRERLDGSVLCEEGAADNRSSFESGSEESDSAADSHHHKGSEPSQSHKEWFEVLGVAEDASLDEVRAAYRKKIALYHPDKVSALGPEFSVVAEHMTKEINAAYQRGMDIRS